MYDPCRTGFQIAKDIAEQNKRLPFETMLPILTGRDSFLIMPTGAGKSLCYQIPALYYFKAVKATAVVVSPLIALMKYQVDALREVNIPAE